MTLTKLTILSALFLTIGCGPIDVDLGDLSTDGDNGGGSAAGGSAGSGVGGAAGDPASGSGGWGASGGEPAGGTGGWGVPHLPAGSPSGGSGGGGGSGLCLVGIIGDGESCHDASTVDAMMQRDCEALGLSLQSVSSENCEDGSVKQAHYQCCREQPLPACAEAVIDAFACMPEADLERAAQDACAGNGQVLRDATVESAGCEAGEGMSVIYECCSASTECRGGLVAASLKDCADNEMLRELAARDCGSTGQVVTAATFDNACSEGRSSYIAYECCSEGEPPPQPGCVEDSIRLPECASNDVVRAQAERACADRGAWLSSFEPDNGCDEIGSSSANFTCCDRVPPPTDEVCWDAAIGGGGECSENRVLYEQAVQYCFSDGSETNNLSGVVRGMAYGEQCGTDSSYGATVTCCTTAP